ncbi:hypothetical protein Q3H58_000722 [Pseudomonas psychrotolerans]|nr:hypothetical protein [Pseudomonas psychrotolerans]
MAALVPLLARALFESYQKGDWRALKLNGVANLLLGGLGFFALMVFDDRIYGGADNLAWGLALLVPLGFALAGLGALLWPRETALAPALALWLVLPLLTVALPKGLVYNKLPSVFIQEHLGALQSAHWLVSNDLGPAASLAWATHRTDVVLVGGPGELKYGFARRPDSGRLMPDGELPAWIDQHRRQGSIAVLLRMSGDSDDRLLASLPAANERLTQERLVLLIYSRRAP